METSTQTKYYWPIVGHSHLADFLKRTLSYKLEVAAYLFSGPGRVGKTLMANYFIQSLLCQNHYQRPCAECTNCVKYLNRSHPDVSFLEKSADKKNISIEQIRESIVHRLTLSSFSDGPKVALIIGAENLSAEAANSLLKTLEEPTRNTLIILTADSLANIPKTIISRCLHLEFQLVPTSDIYQFIKTADPTVDRTTADAVSRLAEGRPGLAWEYLNVPDSLKERQDRTSEFISLLTADFPERFSFLGELTVGLSFQESAETIADLLHTWRTVVRDLMLLKFQHQPYVINYFATERLSDIANFFTPDQLLGALSELVGIQNYLKRNINPRLALENFFLRF